MPSGADRIGRNARRCTLAGASSSAGDVRVMTEITEDKARSGAKPQAGVKIMMSKERFCEYCGKNIGAFVWNRADGALTCGARECERWAQDQEREQEDHARYFAEQDGYTAYGGPGRW